MILDGLLLYLKNLLDTLKSDIIKRISSVGDSVGGINNNITNLSTKIGNSSDIGGTQSTGSVMAKLNALQSRSTIKSIQRGVLGPGATLTVNHSSVDINRSMILLNGSIKSSTSYDYSPIITQRTSTSFTLKPSYATSLTSVQTDSNGVSWQLIEFN